jgi:hypothetical protein
MALTATAHAAEPPEGAASPPVYQIVTREEWRAATPDGHVQDVAVIQTPGYWGAGRSFSAQVFADGRYVFDGKRKTRHEGKQWMVLADPTIFGRLAAYIEAMDEYTCGGGAITDQGFMRYVVGPADLPEDADEAKGTMERLMARRAAETRREYYLGCLGGADFIYDATVWELLGLEDLAGPRHRFTD